MSGLRLSVAQKIVLGCAVIGLAFLFLIVPYQAVRSPGSPAQVSGSAGYHFIFSQPDAVDCTEAIARSIGQDRPVSIRGGCRTYVDKGTLVLSVLAYLCGVLALLALMSVGSARRPPQTTNREQFRYGEADDRNRRGTIPPTPTPLI